MLELLERHADRIQGVLSCFDRIVGMGTLPDICHAEAMTRFLNTRGIRIFDFTVWAKELAEAIRRVHAGNRVIDPTLAADAWTEADPLTDRERQVLRLAGEGLTSSDIAATLQLSEGTVRNYLSEAISKLGAKNRVEAANLARAKGWL